MTPTARLAGGVIALVVGLTVLTVASDLPATVAWTLLGLVIVLVGVVQVVAGWRRLRR